jgi:hypothetical protein
MGWKSDIALSDEGPPYPAARRGDPLRVVAASPPQRFIGRMPIKSAHCIAPNNTTVEPIAAMRSISRRVMQDADGERIDPENRADTGHGLAKATQSKMPEKPGTEHHAAEVRILRYDQAKSQRNSGRTLCTRLVDLPHGDSRGRTIT